MIFLFDLTLFVIDIHHITLISLFPAPFDHFHFHPTLGLDPALRQARGFSMSSVKLEDGIIIF